MALCTQKKMKAIDEMACNQCCLAKDFQAKKGLKTQIFISWRLFSPSSYTFLLFEVPYFAHGTKRKPITKKSVKPRVTFSCFKASFLWLSRTLWQWMNFCRDKPQHTIPNFQKCPKSSSLAKTYIFAWNSRFLKMIKMVKIQTFCQNWILDKN